MTTVRVELLTVKDAAKKYNIPVSTIYRYIKAGRLRTVKLGGIIHVDTALAKTVFAKRRCPECGAYFVSRIMRKKFCSDRCNKRYNAREWYRRKRRQETVG